MALPPAVSASLPKESVSVTLTIEGDLATTELRRVFANPTEEDVWRNATFLYPLNAFPTRLALIHGGIVEESHVVQAAGDSTSGGTPPPDAWIVGISAPEPPRTAGTSAIAVAARVPAGSSVEVVAAWQEQMRIVRGAYRYRLPAELLGPTSAFLFDARASLPVPVERADVAGGYTANLTGVGTTRLNATVPLRALAAGAPPLWLNLTLHATGAQGVATSCLGADGGYFTYFFFPSAIALSLDPLPKSISFALDFSGSMTGSNELQVKQAFAGILPQLREEDRFEVLRFDSRVLALTSGLEGASPENLTRAVERIDAQVANGSTNLGAALERALKDLSNEVDHLPILVLMTDGVPSVGIKETSEILALAREQNTIGAQIFTIGLGSDSAVALLESLSAQSGGTAIVIDPRADVVRAISDFYDTISEPVIQDLNMTFFEPAYDTFPQGPSTYFGGSALTTHGRLRPFAGKVQVAIDGRSTKGDFAVSDSFLPSHGEGACLSEERAWALAKAADLLEEIRASGGSAAAVTALVEVALRYGLVTPYTTFELPGGGTIPVTEAQQPEAPPPQPPAPEPAQRLLGIPALDAPAAAFALAVAVGAGIAGVLYLRARRPLREEFDE